MKKSDIISFVYKYVDLDGEPVEAVTEYRHFNKEKVLKDQDKIVSFFNNIYDFKDMMDLHSLLTDKEGNKLFIFNNLFDLDEFEDLVGLLLMANIFQDDYILRFVAIKIFGMETQLLERSLNNLDTFALEKEYVNNIEECILPYYVFKTNMKLLEKSKELEAKKNEQAKVIISEENKVNTLKEVMGHWFHKSTIPIIKKVDEYFDVLLETRLNDVINFMVMSVLLDIDGPTSLVLNIVAYNDNNVLNEIEKKYNSLSKGSKEKFEYMKERLIDILEKELQERNARKK